MTTTTKKATAKKCHITGVLSYPALLKPQENKLNGKVEYSMVLLFTPEASRTGGDGLKELKDLIRAVGVEKWGPDQAKWPRPFRLPIRDQREKERDGKMPEGMHADAVFVTLRSNNPPGIVGPDNARIVDASQIYAGCVVKVSINAYAYGGPGTKFTAGIGLGLGNLQKQRDGAPLGGVRIAPEVEFAPVDEETVDASGGAAAGVSADRLI